MLISSIITKGYGASAFIVTKGYHSTANVLITATVSTASGITFTVDVLTGDLRSGPVLLNGYPVPQSVAVTNKTLVVNGKLFYKIKNSNYYIGMN